MAFTIFSASVTVSLFTVVTDFEELSDNVIVSLFLGDIDFIIASAKEMLSDFEMLAAFKIISLKVTESEKERK